MAESDKKVAVLPWFDSDCGEDTIHSFKDIPTSLFLFKKYFQKAKPNEKGGMIYTDLFLNHSKPIDALLGDMSWWLKKEKIDIYVKEIQSEATTRLGWLSFSFGEIHIKTLMTEISLLSQVAIAGRFKLILEDHWDPDIDNEDRLKGVHLECTRSDERSARTRLKQLYLTDSTEYPLGIRMRLIPEYKDIEGNINNIKKVANLKAKKAHFLKALSYETSDIIMDLDITHSTLKLTLRGMVMSIKSWDEKPSTLFHGVNQSWKGSKIKFSYLPTHAYAAKMRIDGLIQYLRHKYGDDAIDFFVPGAVHSKSDWTWDDVNKVIINPMSKDLEMLDEADADYNFVPVVDNSSLVGTPVHHNAAALTSSHLERVVTGEDNDSMSTLGNNTYMSKVGFPRTIGTILRGSPMSGGYNISDQSFATMGTLVSQIEQNIKDMETNLAATINKSMEDMFIKFTRNMTKPTGADTGGSND